MFTTRPLMAQDANFHIYLAFGQSNMVGATAITEPGVELSPRVRMMQSITCEELGRSYGEWYPAVPPLFGCNGGVGLADSFLKNMAEAAPTGVTIGIVPTAVAGSDIALFEKGAPIGRGKEQETRIPPQFDGGYTWLLDLARRAQKVGVIKGIIFHQGETNAGDPRWKYQVQQLVADLRADLNLEQVPFVAGELMTIEVGSCCGFHNYQVWELPQLIPQAHVVSAAGLKGFDNAHFTAESYRELGRRYASVMVSASEPADVAPPTNIGCGISRGHAKCCAGAGASINVGSWGYQVGQSCIFTEPGPAPEPSEPAECGTARGRPVCCNGAKSDPDGDGWGWENQQSCIVMESAPADPPSGASCGTQRGTPVCCQGAATDSDGDGWGWEDARSCVVVSQ